MSRIEELIAEHCPNGVPHIPFSEAGTFTRGGGPQKKDFQDTGVGCIHYGQIYTFYGTAASIANEFVSEEVASKSRQAQPGDVIIAVTGENDDDLARGVAWLGNEPVVVSNHTLIFNSDLDPRYVSYYLRSSRFDKDKRRHIMGTKVRSLAGSAFAKILIPTPPLEVQRAIVEIFDTFSMLEAELEAERLARIQQYEHYRYQVIRQAELNSNWFTLYEIAERFGRGKSKHRPRNDSRLYGGPYPFIQTGDIRNSSHLITEYSQTYSEMGLAQSELWPQGTVCITIAANIAETGILQFEACFPDSVIGLIVDPEKASPGYVEYLLRSRKDILVAKGQGSAQANINLATFKEVCFPFPPLREQVRIAEALDKFDTLVSDLSVGLPAELAARRQQYEYYRDELLTFKELAS